MSSPPHSGLPLQSDSQNQDETYGCLGDQCCHYPSVPFARSLRQRPSDSCSEEGVSTTANAGPCKNREMC